MTFLNSRMRFGDDILMLDWDHRNVEAEHFARLAREIARSAPEVRQDRIDAIKVKLQDPNYINNAILESTAEGILKSFGL